MEETDIEAVVSNKKAKISFSACVKCGSEENLKTLSCFHSCCEECIADSDIQCCVCGIQTDRHSASNLLAEFHRARKESEAFKPCVICKNVYDRDNPGIYLCIECDGDCFCEECLKSHSTLSATKNHKPRKFEEGENSPPEKYPKCSQHTNEQSINLLTLYCELCAENICEVCKILKHDGPEHLVVPRSTLPATEPTSLLEHIHDLENLIHHIDDLLKKSEQGKVDKRKNIIILMQELEESVSSVKQAIEKVANDRKLAIAESSQQHDVELNQYVSDLKQFKITVNNAVSLANEMDEGTNVFNNGTFTSFLAQEMQATKEKVKKSCEGFLNLMERDIFTDLFSSSLNHEATKQLVGQYNARKRALQISEIRDQLSSKMRRVSVPKKPSHLKVAAKVTMENLKYIWDMKFNEDDDILVVGDIKSGCPAGIQVYNIENDISSDISVNVLYARGLAIYKDHLFVACGVEGYVKKFNNHGYLMEIIEPPNEQRCVPWGVTVLNDTMYFSDCSETGKVFSCHLESNKPFQFNRGTLELPSAMYVTPEGDLGVYNNHKVTILDQEGKAKEIYQNEFTSEGFYATSLVGTDRILVCRDKSAISLLTPNFQFIGELLNSNEFGIDKPRCVATSRDGRYLAIAHSGNKVVILEPNEQERSVHNEENSD